MAQMLLVLLTSQINYPMQHAWMPTPTVDTQSSLIKYNTLGLPVIYFSILIATFNLLYVCVSVIFLVPISPHAQLLKSKC